MKRSSFTGLLYREYYLSRSSYLSALITFLVCALLGILMMLSFRFGNLGLLFGDMSGKGGGIIEGKALPSFIRALGTVFIKYFPPLMTYIFVITSANTAAKDILTSWNRFEHSMPVTPLRFAAVKTTATAMSLAVSLILSWAYFFIIHSVSEIAFTYRDMSAVVFCLAFGTVISILAQIFITLLKNRDMGFLCSIAAFLIPTVIISTKNGMEEEMKITIDTDTASMISGLIDKAWKLLPLMLTIIAVLFAGLFISMYLLYKRREK